MKDSNVGGRPRLTSEQKNKRKEFLFHKLEPYLMSGISMNKALKCANINNSEVYKYISEDELFGEKIECAKQYLSVIATQAITKELFSIIEKQVGNKLKGTRPQPLSKEERNFLWKYALNIETCKTEWGRKKIYVDCDPDAEIQKLYRILV